MQTCIWMYPKRFIFLFFICWSYELTTSEPNENFNSSKVDNEDGKFSSSVLSVISDIPSSTDRMISNSPVFQITNSDLNNKLENLETRILLDGIASQNDFQSSKTESIASISKLEDSGNDPLSKELPNINIIAKETPIINDKSIDAHQTSISDQILREKFENPIPTPVSDPKIAETVQNTSRKIDSILPVVINATEKKIDTVSDAPASFASSNLSKISSKTKDVDQTQESEDMPSFDEWKKKMLLEQQNNVGDKPIQLPSIPSKKTGGQASKRRRINYASSECGAKVVASNSDAEAPNRILNEQMDMYMLNPCKAKVWFIIELCETIQATQFEMANFELFSSLPKDITLHWSDRFPTRDWTPLGSFEAPDQRILHSFNLKQKGYGKFLKVELQSHYGREHYCPLSLVRVYGTSMVDEYEEMETGGIHSHHAIAENDDEKLDTLDGLDASHNLFGSAREVVYNIVRKAARALGREDDSLGEKSNLQPDANLIYGAEKTADLKLQPPIQPNRTTHALEKQSQLFTLGRLLDECGLCVENLDAAPCLHSRKCLFLLSVFNISTVASFCQTTACSLAEARFNKSLIIESSSATILTTQTSDSFKIASDDLKSKEKETVLSDTMTSMATSLPIKIEHTMAVVEDNSILPSVEPQKELKPSSILESIVNNSSEAEIPEVKGTQIVEIDTKMPVLQSSLSETPPPVVIPAITTEEQLSPTPVLQPDEISTSVPLAPPITEDQHQELLSMVDTLNLEDENGVSTSQIPVNLKTETVVLIDGNSPDSNGRPIPVHNVGINIPTGQKESVFMRLSNRIKVLEMNMSLSSQYLQELSQRYRRQMEEMQRGFNRTVAALNDTAMLAASRDKLQQDAIRHLQTVVTNITLRVDALTNERESLYKQVLETHLFLLVTETFIVFTVLTLCLRRRRSYHERDRLRERSISNASCNVIEEEPVGVLATGMHLESRYSPLKRHNSYFDVSSSLTPEKKRRPSENVSTAGTYADLLIVEPSIPIYIDPPNKPKRRNRNRKNSRGGLARSLSNPTLYEDKKCPNCSETKAPSLVSLAGDLSSTGKLFADKECENCCVFVPALPTIFSPGPKVPLQNVTNGKVPPEEQQTTEKNKKTATVHKSAAAVVVMPPPKEHFSIRKLLKFQKREAL